MTFFLTYSRSPSCVEPERRSGPQFPYLLHGRLNPFRLPKVWKETGTGQRLATSLSLFLTSGLRLARPTGTGGPRVPPSPPGPGGPPWSGRSAPPTAWRRRGRCPRGSRWGTAGAPGRCAGTGHRPGRAAREAPLARRHSDSRLRRGCGRATWRHRLPRVPLSRYGRLRGARFAPAAKRRVRRVVKGAPPRRMRRRGVGAGPGGGLTFDRTRSSLTLSVPEMNSGTLWDSRTWKQKSERLSRRRAGDPPPSRPESRATFFRAGGGKLLVEWLSPAEPRARCHCSHLRARAPLL
jgi:hypothetical protein